MPTFDVDMAFRHIHKGFERVIGSFVKSLISGDFNECMEKLCVFNGLKKDPYDTFDAIFGMPTLKNVRPKFFFLIDYFGSQYDNGSNIYSQKFINLLRHVDDYADIGIHASYASNDDSKIFAKEKQILEKIIHRNVVMNRQHFLKFDIIKTPATLLEHGIMEDYSMGYASTTGFRAGVCVPFYYFNVETNEITRLKIFPVSLMDITLVKYMKFDSTAVINEIKRIIDITKKFHGMFIPLWHNSSLSNKEIWKNKTHIFNEMVTYAL